MKWRLLDGDDDDNMMMVVVMKMAAIKKDWELIREMLKGNGVCR